jgi:hypothetical protein
MKLFRLLGAILWAIPFYYLWNYLAPIYAPQLPAQYLDVPYWHIAGIFALITIVKIVLFRGHGRGRFGRHHLNHHYQNGWRNGRQYFGRYTKFCKRGYWTEKYYHRA